MNISNIRSAAKFKQTVLIIDDQLTALNIHAAILKSLNLNLQIVTMTSPIEALKWMQNKQIDLIITDFRMHKMNGMQFVKALKSSENPQVNAIIVVTVVQEKTLHQELLSAGVYACFTKPLQAHQLANAARNLLEKNRVKFGHSLMESY
jgi:two-component system, chemotaxis family, chemotaxis protein CheY